MKEAFVDGDASQLGWGNGVIQQDRTFCAEALRRPFAFQLKMIKDTQEKVKRRACSTKFVAGK